MRYISRRCVFIAGVISVLVFVTVLQCGITVYPQISACQMWLPLKMFQKLDTTQLTVKSLFFNGKPFNNISDIGVCTVGYSTPQSKTSVNNITLYITSYNIRYGRLGNKMFKYASILGMARRQGRQMFIKPGTDLGKTFKLQYEAVNKEANKWPSIEEENPFAFDVKLMSLPLQNLRIDGFLQSFCYFAEIVDEVRREFTFHDDIALAATNILRDMNFKSNSSMTVGVHARRGDFLRKSLQKLGFGVPEKSYFIKAFSLLKSKFPGRNITFIVASDDLTWCRENLLGENVIVMSPASPSVHLAVLASCDHVIISGGTFGWWAGWLANGFVVYFTGYSAKGANEAHKMNVYQYYPRQWLGLGN